MPTRARQSTASVALSPSQRPSATQSYYEAPKFSLNPDAQRALADLTRKHNLKQLDNKFETARDAIVNSAGEINERLNNKEVAGRKLRQRQQASQNADAEANDVVAAAEADLEQMRVKVEGMTKRMEEGMRRMIDGRLAVEQMKEALATSAESARAEASTQASTLATRSQARRRRGEDEGDEENEEEEYQDFTPTDPAGRTQATQAVPSVSEGWMRKVDDAKIKYQSLSLAQRYAKDNDYVNFKGIVHSSRFPDGEVELPHTSAWFTENGAAPQPGVTGAGGDEDDDDDIQIQRTKTSTKCPLTLQEFKDPVTSTKCKHSFEASAIMEMIRHSNETVGGQPARRGGATGGEKAVRCPVPSCDHMLTKNDLQKDKTIVYHIARLQRARRLEEEDEDDEENGGSGRQRVDLIESDAPDVDDYVAEPVMKKEPTGTARSRRTASAAPRSSRAGGRDSDGDETMEQW